MVSIDSCVLMGSVFCVIVQVYDVNLLCSHYMFHTCPCSVFSANLKKFLQLCQVHVVAYAYLMSSVIR